MAKTETCVSCTKTINKAVKLYMTKLSKVNPYISSGTFEAIEAHFRMGVETGITLAKKHGR